MARRPVTGLLSQYAKNAGGASASGYWLKFFSASYGATTSPLTMYTRQSGGVGLSKCKLNTRGEPISDSGDNNSTFIPYVDGDWDAYIFFTEADADANNTVNSIYLGTNIQPEPDFSTRAIVQFADIDGMIDGEAVDGSSIDYNVLTNNGAWNPKVSTVVNNTTSNKGGTDYIIKTAAQVTADGDVIDGYGSHWLLGGNSYAAVLVADSLSATPEIFGVVPNTASSDVAINAQNAVCFQAYFDFFPKGTFNGRGVFYHTDGGNPIYLGDSQVLNKFIIFGHSSTANTIETKSNLLPEAFSNYTNALKIEHSRISSDFQNAIDARVWQSSFIHNTIVAPLGKGIRIYGGNYSTGNKVLHNQFEGYLYGLYVEEGTYKPTDMTIIDNRFYSAGASSINAIYLEAVSGSVLNKNHYYGGASDAFVRTTSGGSSFRITEEYFEDSAKHIELATGNEANIVIANNSFWVGAFSCITLTMNFRSAITFSGNSFHSGSAVKVFNYTSTTPVTKIYVDSSNSAENGFTSDAFGSNAFMPIGSFHKVTLVDRFANLTVGGVSQYDYTSATNSTGTLTINASDSNTPSGNKFSVVNKSAATTVTFGLSGSLSGAGYTIAGITSLAPHESCFLEFDSINNTIYATSS